MVERATDGALMARIAAGDERALVLLFERHGAAVFGLALSILGDRERAEEVMNDAFLRAARAARAFRPDAAARPWLLSIARNIAIDERRRPRREALLGSGSVVALHAEECAAEATASARELGALVRRALASLPLEVQRTIELAYALGRSRVEIAAELGAPVGTVKTWARRGLIHLRRELGPSLA